MSKKFYLKSVLFCAETTNPLDAIESARMDVERNVQKLANGMKLNKGGSVSSPSNSSIGNTDNTNLLIDSKKFGAWFMGDINVF